jgi:hypothetical protein
MEDGNMKTDQLRKHLQLFTEGTPVPDEDLPGPFPAPAPAPAPSPAPAAGTDMASRLRAAVPYEGNDPKFKDKKMVPLTAEEVSKFKDIFKRLDKLLLKYTKDKKAFESVDFESMTESEQRQYLMQNLNLLSEADQMVVLRAIMNEDKTKIAGDIIKYGIEKMGIPAVRKIWNTGEKAAGKVWNAGEKIIGGIWNAPAVQLTTIGGVAVFVWNHWNELFPPSGAIDQMVSPEDKQELYQLEKDYEAVLPRLPSGYAYVQDDELKAEMGAFQIRWNKFEQAAEQQARDLRSTAKPEPGILDKASGAASDAYDKVRGMFNK